ncbi:hypothetical protein Y032_0109g133 [Ancylostoma ceylanicum]|uniref:Uncharacterized protein n=1 Tax=Ancylostoma ceylanicum TaxID=53326 RepID=A0A016TEX2_9BILA|nr:hypothetical protein Y032_0109g133 [Ancylostoma ceylanicum]
MQRLLMLLPFLLTVAHTSYHDWPLERRHLEDSADYRQRGTYQEPDYRIKKHSDYVFSRERRARLCGKKIIEQLLILCDSCILPIGSELVKRSVDESRFCRKHYSYMRNIAESSSV